MNVSFGYQNCFYFFLSGFPFKNIQESQNRRERRKLFFGSSLPFHSLPKLFRLQRSQLLERFKDERRRCKRIQEPHSVFFVIKTSIRVNKGARFLDLLLNVNFQPLVTKQSFIKIYVTELLDPPQAFTC